MVKIPDGPASGQESGREGKRIGHTGALAAYSKPLIPTHLSILRDMELSMRI